MVLFDELGRIQEVMDAWEREEEEWFLSLIEEGKMVHDVKPAFSLKEILAMLSQQKLFLSLFSRTFAGISFNKATNFSCKPMQQFHGQMALLQSEIERWLMGKFTVLIVARDKDRVKRVQQMLDEYDIHATIGEPNEPGIYITDGVLSSGFELPLQRLAIVTEDELFKQQAKKKKHVLKKNDER